MITILYKINNGAIRYNAETIIENVNIEIKDNEKIAVIGNNGSGKSSLLKLIADEISLSKRSSDEEINIEKYGKINIGYLKQISESDWEYTLEEEINTVYKPVIELMKEMDSLVEKMSEDPSTENIEKYTEAQEEFFRLGGYEYSKDLELILNKLGFKQCDYERKIKEFSGGEQTKIALAKIILSKPDIMLLDEPTNHLDVDMIEWLENYINHYEKAVVIVSHDRMFLDNVVHKVYEIEHKTITKYSGNYTDFIKQKQINMELHIKKYEEQQKQIERLKKIVERFKHIPSKSAMAKAKLKYIERVEKIDMPKKFDLRKFHVNLEPTKSSSREVFRANKLQVGYESVMLEISFLLEKGQKLALMGKNGTGKSTFLKTIMGEINALGGTFSWGNNVDIGYYEQHVVNVCSEKTVLDDFWDEFQDLSQNEVRSYLGAFLFGQDNVYKKVSNLSGGERARLSLAKIFKRQPNVLILDEPTNHMDLIGKETLEDIIMQYSGTVIFVTHDRYFAKKVADSLLVFNENEVEFTKKL